MKLYVVVPLVAVLIAVRVSIFRRRRHQRDQDQARQRPDGVRPDRAQGSRPLRAGSRLRGGKGVLGDVGIIAGREIRERVKGRLFRVGTLIILVAVAAAIIIPKLHSSHSGPTVQKVAVVGSLAPDIRQVVAKTGSRDQDLVRFVSEPSLAAAKAGLRSGGVYVAIVDGNEVLLNEPASLSSSPADPTFVQDVADLLGVLNVYRSAGLTTAQATQVSGARPVPVHTLKAGSKATTNTTSLFGIILLFVMLTQYNTWILIGVMQEKSSRVVEVLLATVRPIQLLGGKVLGIGLVALGQATVIVGFALILAAAVGSDLLHGSAPLVLICELLWLVLGYAFYCWVYAAGRLDRRAPGPGADARLPPQHSDPGGLHLLHHRGEFGQCGPVLQDPRLPAPDGPVLHAGAGGAGPGHLVGVRRLGADHHRRDGRHGHLRRPYLPPGRAAYRGRVRVRELLSRTVH
jgi:ABC-2 type transport system permease protein